jgi:hypothetical protein
MGGGKVATSFFSYVVPPLWNQLAAYYYGRIRS